MTYWKLLKAVALIVVLPLVSSASIILISDGSTVFQQTTNSPCVIGNPSCNQGTFVDNEWSSTPGGSQGSTYDLLSPVYVVGSGSGITVPNTIPAAFSVGIDLNYSAGWSLENLVFFKTLYCTDATGTSCSANAGNSWVLGPTALAQQNGNGYSDAVLSGFSVPIGTYLKFEASVSNDTDGMEQFFLVPAGTPQEIPEPATSALVGAGLLALAYTLRRKRA